MVIIIIQQKFHIHEIFISRNGGFNLKVKSAADVSYRNDY